MPAWPRCFPDTARRFCGRDPLRLTAGGQHAEAFATLKKAQTEGTFIGPPSREMVDAICSINRAVLPRSDAFHLWGLRLNEKSRGRFYEDIEEDLRLLEQDYAEELADIEGIANVNLLIRAEAAEHTNKHENAYARYRELAGRTPLDARLRARANWGLFRLSPPDSADAVRYAELAGDAFLETGDSTHAVKCYASGADRCELQDRSRALRLLNKGLAALDGQTVRADEYRARILYARAMMYEEWRNLPEALTDAIESVRIRRTIAGVDDENSWAVCTWPGESVKRSATPRTLLA